MALEVWDADRLAGILLGLEDAKADLKRYFIARQEGGSKYVEEIVEAAQRWENLVEELIWWPGQPQNEEESDVPAR